MKFDKRNWKMNPRLKVLLPVILFLALVPVQTMNAQNVAYFMLGRFWTGMVDLGTSTTWTPPLFYPNDYDILFNRMQTTNAHTGSGFTIGTARFFDNYKVGTTDTTVHERGSVYGLVGQNYPKPFNSGVIKTPLSSYCRYSYTVDTVDTKVVNLVKDTKTTYNAPALRFPNGITCDQIAEVTNNYIYDISVRRRAMGWSQNFNNNYVIYDLEFTNFGTQSYDSLYIMMTGNMYNVFFSNGSNPQPSSQNQFRNTFTWQHYHGGRVEDTTNTFMNYRGISVPKNLRVYYEYGADDPQVSGDQMGAPAEPAQRGRLTGYLMDFYTILHASGQPYTNAADDKDDFLQPRITYMGNDQKISSSYQSGDDPYGSSNYWAMRGDYIAKNPENKIKGNPFPGTIHGLNSDEIGTPDFTNYPAGTYTSNQALMHSVFGPYKFEPGQKIHIVYASGVAGIDEKTAKEVGNKWMNGTLTDPPQSLNMPDWDPNTGLFPTEFAFPADAKPVDKIKDRWISLGIDSVFLSAYRAKWNYDHNYQIPIAPPPPLSISTTAYSNRIEVGWSDAAAEKLSNFAGYRIMRRISRSDTVFYETVFDTTGDYKGSYHVFKDMGIRTGASYSYYVQSKALIDPFDQKADPTTRGKIIYSGRLYVQDNSGGASSVYPPMPPQDDLSKIRVVPNPYNIADPIVSNSAVYGSESQGRLIFFVNLPPQCTIKIFTENGDLIKTINHVSLASPSGSEKWTLMTESNQVISSGIYIAVIQTPSGAVSYQKFIVVR